MRTTIEISDQYRGILLSLAAQRGLRGYSAIIQEALDTYLDQLSRKDGIKRDVLAMKGTWGPEETTQIKTRISELRENWKP